MSHSDAEIREGVVLENKIEPHIAYNPFNYVEPCEPDCTPERHAYHQGQWEMAQRICESFGVLPNPVDGHDIPINATKAILALIEEQTRLARIDELERLTDSDDVTYAQWIMRDGFDHEVYPTNELHERIAELTATESPLKPVKEDI